MQGQVQKQIGRIHGSWRLAWVLGALLLLAGRAEAGEFLGPQGSTGKSGPFMFNFKLGPAIPVYFKDLAPGLGPLDVLPAQFAMELEFGFALDKDRQAYLTFPFQFEVVQRSILIPFLGTVTASYATVILPVAFQYDIPISAVPGLYIYPRMTLGYAAFVVGTNQSSDTNTYSYGVLIPEFGVKYVFRQRINFGFEPFGLPMFFRGDNNNGTGSFRMEYRLMFYGGINF